MQPTPVFAKTQTPLSDLTHATYGLPVFLPEKSHGQRSLASYCPEGLKESDEGAVPQDV